MILRFGIELFGKEMPCKAIFTLSLELIELFSLSYYASFLVLTIIFLNFKFLMEDFSKVLKKDIG